MKSIIAAAGLSLVLASPALAHSQPGSAEHFKLVHFLTEPDHLLAIAGGLMLVALLAHRAFRAGIGRRHERARRRRDRSA